MSALCLLILIQTYTNTHYKLNTLPVMAGFSIFMRTLCLPTLKKLLQVSILKVSSSLIPTSYLALMIKPIWDGFRKSNCDKSKMKSPFKTGLQGIWAVHIDWNLRGILYEIPS